MKPKPVSSEFGTAFLRHPQNNDRATTIPTRPCNIQGEGRLWNSFQTNILHAKNAQL